MSSQPAKPQPRFRNAKTVATTMGVSHRSVVRWARDGRLKVRRTPGGTYLFEVDEDDWPIEAEERKR